VETASDEMVMWSVWPLFEFSPPVSQQNHSNLSLKALHDALKWFYQKNGIFWKQKMTKSGKAKVDEQLAWESYLLWEQNIHKIWVAFEVQVYGAEKVTTTKWRQFQLYSNKAQKLATKWSDADWRTAKVWLGCEIYLVTPVKYMLFDKLYKHYE